MKKRYNSEALRVELARRQVSVREFAATAKISSFAVYRALSGGVVRTKTLGKISAALGVNPSALMGKEASEIGEAD